MSKHTDDQAIDFITSWLEYQSRQLPVPGFVVAIQRAHTPLLLRAYGKANVERNEPMRADHVFGVASISKMFTATAIMQLVERERLSLDSHITAYLPWLARHADSRMQEVTIRHLLSHTAGFTRDGSNSDFWQLMRPFPDAAQLRAEVLSKPLISRPGGKLKYSNIGYALLGQIIEQVTGKSYAHYVTDEIITPLSLANTSPEYMPDIQNRIATGYTRQFDGRRFPVPAAINTRAFTPLFGWHTNAQDLCRFMAAHFVDPGGLLRPDSQELMHAYGRTHWVPSAYRGTTYGLGFMTQQFGERTVVGHGGVFVGHRSCAYVDAAQKLIVVILANARDAPAIDMLEGILSVFDYFETWGTEPLSPERQRLNVRLMGFWATLQIVATTQRIVSIFPDLWLPFADPDELSQIAANRLIITKTHDFASAGEPITLHFRGDDVAKATYAGTTLFSEHAYWKRLRHGFTDEIDAI